MLLMKTKSRQKKRRITLDITLEFNKRLETLLEKVDVDNKADLIRDALKAYEHIVEGTEKGCVFKMVHPDGEIERFRFFELRRASATSEKN